MSGADHYWQFMHYAYYEDHMAEVWHNYVTGQWREVYCG